MVKLEQIRKGACIKGIVGARPVEIIASRSFSGNAIEVPYKLDGVADQMLLYRGSGLTCAYCQLLYQDRG